MRKKTSRQKRKDKNRFSVIVIVIIALLALDFTITKTDGDLFKIGQAITSRDVNELINTHTGKKIEVVSTSPFSIYYEYKENEVAANQRYKDQRIGIIGKVKNVSMDNNSNAIVNLKVPFSLNSIVSAKGDDTFTEKSAELKKGQRTLMICHGAGLDSDTPKLSDCKLYLHPDLLRS